MNNSEFLEKYHKMVNDIVNAPKIIKNMKQGDIIWYLKYHYDKQYGDEEKIGITLNQYEVSELGEYYCDDDSKPFDINHMWVYVFRNVKSMTMYSTDASVETGVWKTEFKSDGLGFISESYMKSMDGEVYSDEFGFPSYNLEIYGFDKEKVLNRLRQYEGVLRNNDTNKIEKFIEKELNKKVKPIKSNGFDILTDEEVSMYYNHPSYRKIMKWFPFTYVSNLTKEENILNFLKKIMVIGEQKDFREKLKEEHIINTSDGQIDLNKIAKEEDSKLNEVLQYIEDKDLVGEINRYFDYKNVTSIPKLIVYRDEKNRLRYNDLNSSTKYVTTTIFFKEICAILKGDSYHKKVDIATSKEDIIEYLTEKSIGVQLVNLNYI